MSEAFNKIVRPNHIANDRIRRRLFRLGNDKVSVWIDVL